MQEAVFKTRYDSLYSELSRTYEVNLQLWCNNRWDAIAIEGPAYADAMGVINDEVGIYESLVTDDVAMIITENCLLDYDDKFIEDNLEYHNCLLLPPFSYENGMVEIRIIAQELEHLTHLFHDLQQEHSLTVEMKQRVDAISFSPTTIETKDRASDLSRRQKAALQIAYEKGYYKIPRETTTEKLAEQLGVTRRTFEDHLRKAEQKVIGAYNKNRL